MRCHHLISIRWGIRCIHKNEMSRKLIWELAKCNQTLPSPAQISIINVPAYVLAYHGIVFHITDPLWGETTGYRWSPRVIFDPDVNDVFVVKLSSIPPFFGLMCSHSCHSQNAVIARKPLLHYWLVVMGIHNTPMDSTHKDPVNHDFDISFIVNLNSQLSWRRFRRHDKHVTSL